MTANLVKQAAPGNGSTRDHCITPSRGGPFSNGAMDETVRAVISGSRRFNIVFGLRRTEEKYHQIFRHVPKRLPSRPCSYRSSRDRRIRFEQTECFQDCLLP